MPRTLDGSGYATLMAGARTGAAPWQNLASVRHMAL
jgi:hypothetical protein